MKIIPRIADGLFLKIPGPILDRTLLPWLDGGTKTGYGVGVWCHRKKRLDTE
jgi:hypothetical protein